MVGFEYNGKSTATIIDTPLILVSTDSVGSAIGIQRSKIEGERTISRPITNEYGTISDPLSFTYGLMKKDFETFTVEELIAIERWLTSPKLSSKITITNCDEESYSYYGLFTNTDWSLGNGDFMVCNFTFQVNGMYAFITDSKTFNGKRYDDPESPEELTSVDNPFTINMDCNSDELEEFVYPVIEVTALDKGVVGSFKLIPTTDNEISGKYKELNVISHHTATTLVFDCQHCIIGEYITGINNTIKLNTLRYKDLGWNNVGDIYWPRLYPGHNEIKIIGDVEVTISYEAPYKKVGGWLI